MLTVKNTKTALSIISVLVSVIFLGGLFFTVLENIIEIEYDTDYIDRGWTVYLNGAQYNNGEKTDLREITFPDLEEGDTVTFMHTINTKDFKDPVIVFDAWNSTVNVSIDRTPVYSFGHKFKQDHRLLALYRNQIHIPKDAEGKTISISFKAIIDNPAAHFGPVGMFESTDPDIVWFHRSVLLGFMGFFLISISIIFLIFVIRMGVYRNFFFKQLMFSQSFFLIGLYFLAKAKVLPLMFSNISMSGGLEYLVLYLMPLSVSPYSGDIFFMTKNRQVRDFYIVTIILYAVVLFGGIVLSLKKYCYLSELLSIFFLGYFLMLSNIISFFIAMPRSVEFRRDTKYDIIAAKVFVIGSTASILLEFLSKNPAAFDALRLWRWGVYVAPLFLFIMIAVFINSHFHQLTGYIFRSRKMELMKNLAHMDALTGIGNRLLLEEKVEELEKEQADYSLISIDLNNLKYYNDMFGHAKGDDLLRAFAECLRRTNEDFDGKLTVCRVGGDEFSIIYEDRSEYDDIIESIRKHAAEKEEEEDSVRLSFAYGNAVRSETESPKDVFALADARMYEQKTAQKKASGVASGERGKFVN